MVMINVKDRLAARARRDSGRAKAVVFDIGGVLERVDDMSWLQPWSERAGISLSEVGSRLELFELDERIATGQLSESAYRARYAEVLKLDAEGADAFMQEMWQWYCGELDQEMYDFAASLRPAYIDSDPEQFSRRGTA